MDHTQPSITSTAQALEATFDGQWGIWRSDTGQWWASRRDSLSSADLATGCVPFLRADTPDELTELLQEQEALSLPGQGGGPAARALPASGSEEPGEVRE
jgi:hypothetical protein